MPKGAPVKGVYPRVQARNRSGNVQNLPIYYIDTEIEIQVANSFIYQKMSFLNTSGSTVDGVFYLPTSAGRAHVMSCDVSFGGSKTFSTSIIDEEAGLLKSKNEGLSNARKDMDLGDAYSPDVFTMPFQGVPPNAEIIVEARYTQDCSFDAFSGEYSLCLPMSVPLDALHDGQSLQSALTYKVLLCTGTASGNWRSDKTQLRISEDPSIPDSHILEGSSPITADFHIAYTAWADSITGSTLVSPDGAFVAFLQPPSYNLVNNPISRQMVFLLDRSLSMTNGTVFMDAKNALISALGKLSSTDSFNICAYDDKTLWYAPMVQQASYENVERAKNWLRDTNPNGLTDILTPIREASELLKATSSPNSLPYIVLLTDGAVYQEQEHAIFDYVRDFNKAREKEIRLFTFGIGPFCNKAFLQQLADCGRGYTEICLDINDMERCIDSFCSKTLSPVLGNINVDVPIGTEIYPTTIPDLSVGAPLLIYGQFPQGKWNETSIGVNGINHNGVRTSITLNCKRADNAPIKMLVDKKKLDILVGQWYMAKNEKDKHRLRTQAINDSIETNVPCYFTRQVAYENTEPLYIAHHDKHGPPPGMQPATKVSRIDQIANSEDGTWGQNRNRKVKKLDKKSNTGAIVGGVVVVGAGLAAFAYFGSSGATNAGASVADALTSIDFGGLGGTIGDGLAAGWDGLSSAMGSIPWGDIGSGIGDAAGAVGNFAVDAAGTIGNVAGDAAGVVADGAGDAVGFCGDLCGSIDCGGIIGGVGDAVGGICGSVGDVCGALDCGAIADTVGGVCGGLGEVLGGLADIVGGLLN